MDWLKDKFYYKKKYNTLLNEYEVAKKSYTKTIEMIGETITQFESEKQYYEGLYKTAKEQIKELKKELKEKK